MSQTNAQSGPKKGINYIGVVQVTYFSPEFPGKSLSSLGEMTSLEFLLERLKEVKFWKKVVVATTTNPSDDPILQVAEKMGTEVFRGDPQNVLERIYLAGLPENPDGIIKFLGNAPLVDLDEMEILAKEHWAGGYDYAYNEHVHGVIYGTGSSVFSFSILEQLVHKRNLTNEQKEIGSLYIRQNPDQFKILRRNSEINRPLYKVLIDEPKDVELVKSIIKNVPQITNCHITKFLDENPLLVDYQKGSGVSETGTEKLFLFSEKIQQYQRNGYFDKTYPVSVELSLTNRCNFKCIWCSDLDLRERLGGDLTLEKYDEIVTDLKEGGTKGVVIEGGGEPTIHPQFREIVQMTAAKGLAIGLITNGSIPIKEDIIPLFEWIRVSLDASTKEQHTLEKKVKSFEGVLKNIKYIGKHKGKTVLGIGYVVTKNNVEFIENLLPRLKMYNVDYIQFRPVIDSPDLCANADLSYLKKYETPRFKVDIGAMSANAIRGNGGKPCVAHSLSSVITADGGVYICGRLNIYDWMKPIGNLYRQSFREIWFGEERKRQSRMVADSHFCTDHCPECRLTKYNLLVNRLTQIKTQNFI